jgi:hypothetical protein
MMVEKMNSEHNSRPVPDPTRLTTEQLIREIGAARELIDKSIEGTNRVIVQLQAEMDKVPGLLRHELENFARVQDVKFEGIKTQFAERDTRTDQTSRDSKVAVDAALQAAKEAVGEQNRSSALAIAKSEAATTKQIDQLGILIQTSAGTTESKITDIKERLTRIEGEKAGGKAETTTRQMSTNSMVGIIGVMIAASLLTVALITNFARQSEPAISYSPPQAVVAPLAKP